MFSAVDPSKVSFQASKDFSTGMMLLAESDSAENIRTG